MPRGMPSTGSSSHTCWPQAGSFALPSVEYNGSATHARGLSSTSPKRGDAALTTAPSSQGHAASSSYLPNSKQAETAGGYEIFVGDLSQNISDAALRAAFSSWATLIDARVMWDTSSGKSRGYGFVTFHSKLEAEHAIAVMNGEVMGYRPVRVNWATVKKPPSGPRTKPQVSLPRRSHAIALGMPPTAGAASGTPLSYQTVDSSAPLENTTIYVGNLPLTTSAGDLVMIFSRFSSVRIRDVRMHPNKGYAFVRLDTHENATRAIVFAAGHVLHNTRIKTGWAKDRLETNTRGVGSVSSTDASGTPPAGGGFCADRPRTKSEYNRSLLEGTNSEFLLPDVFWYSNDSTGLNSTFF